MRSSRNTASSITSSRKCDLFLDEHDAGTCEVDAEHRAALDRRRDRGVKWSRIVRGRDAGGIRDFLDGRPIHCGTGLELQAVEVRYDDYGSWLIRLEKGARVRYEVAWQDDEAKVILYAIVADYEFTAPLGEGMRFRWPGGSR